LTLLFPSESQFEGRGVGYLYIFFIHAAHAHAQSIKKSPLSKPTWKEEMEV
jgi:hypothetical protein